MLDIINSILWAVATVLIVYSGIYYTFKLKFVQFRFKSIFKSFKTNTKGLITPFQSLMMVLGGRIGVGSIAGIALSISLGGIGTIFWIWIIGFLSAANSFAETVLGIKYQEYDEKKIYKGGPSYYLKKGLNKNRLSKIYALIIIFSQIGGFLSIQSNTITRSITKYIEIKPFVIGLIITLISFLIISGGVKKISKVSSKLVPIMTLIYVVSALIIVVLNIKQIPIILISIVKEAFNIKSFGFGILSNIIIGIQRGIFSNEAGLGTGAIASSLVDVKYSASQGFVQMIGIYITTFLVCTATSIVILTSPVFLQNNNINGIEITQEAFIYHFGNFGNIIVILSIILFSFSTILSGYYDAESSLKYLVKTNKANIFILKLVSLIVIFVSSFISSNILWNFVNMFTALLAIINIYAMINLKDHVLSELREYENYDTIK